MMRNQTDTVDRISWMKTLYFLDPEERRIERPEMNCSVPFETATPTILSLVSG